MNNVLEKVNNNLVGVFWGVGPLTPALFLLINSQSSGLALIVIFMLHDPTP